LAQASNLELEICPYDAGRCPALTDFALSGRSIAGDYPKCPSPEGVPIYQRWASPTVERRTPQCFEHESFNPIAIVTFAMVIPVFICKSDKYSACHFFKTFPCS